MSLLTGTIAFVTGGSSGIGLATAKRFVEESAYVFIAGLIQEGAAEARKQIMAMTPLARLASPEEIACVALFLASDKSSYVAGIDLSVDGGLTAI